MATRAKTVALGCGLGCLGVIVLALSTCIGFRVWLETPGPLLDPAVLVDPAAVGWAQFRLDLEDEGTEALAASLFELTSPPEEMFEGSPVFGLLSQINARRQERQMRRLFPATVVWTLHPGEPGEDEPLLVSASIPRMSHTIALVDWTLGLIAPRQPELVTETYRGERILVIADTETQDLDVTLDGDGIHVDGGLRIDVQAEDSLQGLGEEEGEREPFTSYVFLRDVGVFFATSPELARRAIDGLERGPAQASGAPLERLLADLPDAPIRGGVINDGSRLSSMLESLLPDGVLDDGSRAVVDGARAATLLGVLHPEARLELTLTLRGVATDEAALESLAAAARRWVEATGVDAGSEVAGVGDAATVTVTLPVRELAERARGDWR